MTEYKDHGCFGGAALTRPATNRVKAAEAVEALEELIAAMPEREPFMDFGHYSETAAALGNVHSGLGAFGFGETLAVDDSTHIGGVDRYEVEV